MKTKKFCQKIGFLAVALAGVFLSIPAQALTVNLAFNKLPSAQGWTFSAKRWGEPPVAVTIPESSVFSVSNGILHQNTLGQNDLEAIYVLNNYVNPNKPYSITVKARLLAQDSGTEPYSFDFGVQTNVWFTGFAIGIGEIWDQHGTLIANGIDTSVFHTYRFDGTPDGSYTFYIDGKYVNKGTAGLFSSLPYPFSIPPTEAMIYFGDGTPSGSNAKGEIASYTFTQPSVTGNVKNLQPSYTIKCTNETTGQSVNISSNKLNTYDCEAKGLLKINPNDAVSVLIKGNSK
jgi:hypothetical protein